MPKKYYQDYNTPKSPDADDFRQRSEKKVSVWKIWVKYIGIAIVGIGIILLILNETGNLNSSPEEDLENNTPEVSQGKYDELITYILAQQSKGLTKQEIINRLTLAGFDEQEINTAYELTDPIIQEILRLEKEGMTQQEIVEYLLEQDIEPEKIRNKYQIIEESRESGFSLEDNWIWLVLGLAAAYFVYTNSQRDAEEGKFQPKVYTLDECEEYAKEYLDKKGKIYNPSKKYRNRPDIRQYRFIYEEKLFPEFNDHYPTGHKIGRRTYYLIAIGYDREVIDYLETQDDTKIHNFLYGAPKGFEQAGSKEYMGLRAQSEKPIEEKKRTYEFDEDDDNREFMPSRFNRRRNPYSKIRPGPVGYRP